MRSTKEKISYCIGLEAGSRLRHQFAEVDRECLEKGFLDGLGALPPALTKEEIQSHLTLLRNQMEAQQKQQLAAVSEENRKQGEAFLKENQHKEGVQTLSSGLQYKVLQAGAPEGELPTLLDVVTVHYRGTFVDGRLFDSSYQRGEPAQFPLNRVISGWSEILQKMRIGDKWQVVIPSYLAYGEMGFGQEIGPNSTLVFEMELLGINQELSATLKE